MLSLSEYRAQWFCNIRGDLLSGLVVALALIPEAIAFSIIAGRRPQDRALRFVLDCGDRGDHRRAAGHDFGRDRRQWRC
jgi:hypothetical protein